MEMFIQAFLAIDVDQSEEISLDELRVYAKKKGLEGEMDAKWLSLFDTDDDNKISLTEFCDTLGLVPEEIRAKRCQKQYAGVVPKLNNDIEVLVAKIDLIEQVEISDKMIELLTPETPDGTVSPNSATQWMKKHLDDTHGRTWHVVIIDGPFWMSYSHQKDCAFQFRYKNKTIVLWRTQ